MPKYLTVAQYQRSADGMATASVLASEVLASFIQRAEADVDSYMGFDLLLGGFEPHTAWYQEAWNQHSLKTRIPNTPVPVRNVSAYKIQVSNVSTAGAGFFAQINPGDIVFNVQAGYVEIVPLTAVTYALTPVLIALGMQPPVVQMDYEVGFFLAVRGDTLYDTGDHTTYRATRGFWAQTYTQAINIRPLILPPVPPVIYANANPVASANYSVNYTEGSVTFTTAQTSLPSITADYTYQIPDPVKAATIAQTSYLIGQSDLNSLGMQGVMTAHNDHQEIRRDYPTRDTQFSVTHPALCRTALGLLMRYGEQPIA